MEGCHTAARRWLLLPWLVQAQNAAAAAQVVQQARWAAAASLQLSLQLLCRDGAQVTVTLELQLQQQPLQEPQLQICRVAAAAVVVDAAVAAACLWAVL